MATQGNWPYMLYIFLDNKKNLTTDAMYTKVDPYFFKDHPGSVN